MHISILEAKFVRKKCALYTGKYGSYYVIYPGAPLRYFNDGGGGGGMGGARGSYFIPKKMPTSEFVFPKKPNIFSIPKKIQHQQYHIFGH